MIKKIIGVALVITLILLLDKPIKSNPILPDVPFAIGKLLNPFSGYPALIGSDKLPEGTMTFPNLIDTVNVKWDEFRIPHIEAKNELDLYFMQGYIMAFDRLWQMEFQTHAAAGRLSEIFGDRALEHDRFQRRIGMIYAAENTIAEIKKNPDLYASLESFTDGINFYINSLDKNKYPIEYKLLNYKPEEWTPLKTSLLLKSMAWSLTSRTQDLEYTKILNDFKDGEGIINDLFPIFPQEYYQPIVTNKAFDFVPYKKTKPDSIYKSKNYKTTTTHNKNSSLGSNNWVIDSSLTVNRVPILSNDPHLNLNLPSIWYLMHLKCPEMNVMGVTIPGAPGIIIGFNDKISWGVTNGYDDSMDWYDIQYKNEKKKRYKHGKYWKFTTTRIEEIIIKDESTFYDTIIYTHHGPIVGDFNYFPKDSSIHIEKNYGLALQWTAHDSTNELLTFYLLNRASNYDEFEQSLKSYDCPGQNFVYSDIYHNIAIYHTGKNPIKFKRQGMFISDGTNPYYDWENNDTIPDYIPFEHKVFNKNPNQGYLVSANQNPVSEDVDYYYLSEYFAPSYRANQINFMIENRFANTNQTRFEIDDMKKIQLDNTCLVAKNTLQTLLDSININEEEDNDDLYFWINILENWKDPEYEHRFKYEGSLLAPTFFEEWINDIEKNTWSDDFQNIIWPEINTLEYLITHKSSDPKWAEWFDDKNTDEIETLKDICTKSFYNIVEKLSDKSESELEWQNYRGTDITHLMNIEEFSSLGLKTSGAENIINATRKNEGPSWRYIIEMSQPYKILGIYPGGQSGYPGSFYYDNFIPDWVSGGYKNLIFPNDNNEFEGTELRCIPEH